LFRRVKRGGGYAAIKGRLDFDAYKDTYRDEVERSISFIGRDLDFFTELKAHVLLRIARELLEDTKSLTALDVGCGVGSTDSLLAPNFRELYGVDVAQQVVDVAARRNPSVAYSVCDTSALPFDDDVFDLVFAINVFHHVQPPERLPLFKELARVAGDRGLVTVFEHNPLNPLTRLAVDRCEFDVDAVLISNRELTRMFKLAGLQPLERSYIVFFPWRGRLLRAIERQLSWLPFGAQHVVAGRSLSFAPITQAG